MAKMTAGTYFIGDPCYCFSRDSWLKLIDMTGCFDNGDHVEFNQLGNVVAFGRTDHGDGTYLDQFGHQYSVDAGLLGAVPINLNEEMYDDLNELGKVFTFEEEWEFDADDGLFNFGGKIIIDTTHEDWDESDWDESEDQEDWDDEDN